MTRDLLELYRWPDGHTMVRPITAKGRKMSFPGDSGYPEEPPEQSVLFTLMSPEGKALNQWYLKASEPVEDQNKLGIWDDNPDTLVCWRGFFFDMLVSADRVMAGVLDPNSYLRPYHLPMGATLLIPGLQSPQYRQLQALSLDYHEKTFEVGDYIKKMNSGLADQIGQQLPPTWSGIKDVGDEGKATGWDIAKGPDNPNPLSLYFDNFQNPAWWNLDHKDMAKKWGWEWFVTDRFDAVLSVGHTPDEALSGVKQLVWPNEFATDERLSLEAWMKKWVVFGTPSIDLTMYKLLGLPLPIMAPHSEFKAFAEGLDV